MSSRQQQHQQNQRGIDIVQALEILAARGGGDNNTSSTSHQHNDCCNCQNSPFSAHALQNNAVTMGKVIDIFGNNDNDAAAAATTMEQQSHDDDEEMKKRRQQRQVEMQEQLQSMSMKELLQTVLQAQEERVATYRRYDEGLQGVLQSNGNMTQYPTIVAEATASFAVLSDTIRSIRQVLLLLDNDDNNNNNNATTTKSTAVNEKEVAAQLLSRLQMAEQNKLHLTAALHLEKIRIYSATATAATPGESSRAVGKEGDDEHQDDTATSTNKTTNSAAADIDNKINRLYRESIASLQTKIEASVEEINEVLDEIRCTMMEE